jgi:conjugal transfer ATP-binding protein TraC
VLQREVYFSDFAYELDKVVANDDPENKWSDEKVKMAELIGAKLGDYVTGSYRRMFNGEMQFSLDEKLTVFETEEMDLDNVAECCYYMALLNMVYEEYQKPELASLVKELWLEEGWMALKSSRASAYLNNIYRTSRKFGFSCLIITQQPEDFLAIQAGRAIFANSPNKFMLQQEKDMIPLIAKEMSLSDTQANVLSNVHTSKGFYSEVYMKGQKNEGVYKLIPDPILYWIMSTDTDDKALRKKYSDEYEDEGLSSVLAAGKSVLRCAREYPNGVTRAAGRPDDPLLLKMANIDLGS